jgi:hypothetical protein
MTIGTPVMHIVKLLLVRGSGSRPEPGEGLAHRTSLYTHSAKFVPEILLARARIIRVLRDAEPLDRDS